MTTEEALVIAFRLLAEPEDLGQCWHETTESRVGACDGGFRCPRPATYDDDGAAYCDKHFRWHVPEGRA